MKTNRELRAAARAQLEHSIFSSRWLFAAVIILLVSLLTEFLNSFLIGILLFGPLTVGLHSFLLSIAHGREELDVKDILCCFSEGRFVRAMVLGFLNLFYVFLWSLLFLIPGIVKSYSYRLSYYLSLDYPELKPEECITLSRRLMDGYKKQAFLLDLSMIGWYLLGALACGIGTILVDPYAMLARTNFYLSIIEHGHELLPNE